MNNKILSVVLVAGVAVTGFAGISSASEAWTDFLKGNSEIREIKQKIESGIEITDVEQATLDEARSNRVAHGGKRKGGWGLTNEEKTLIETMSDEEKKAFFDAKKVEMKAKKDSHKAVIAKLVAWGTLSQDEELARVEILERLSGDKASAREGTDIIKKLVNGETLTADDQSSLDAMQAKYAERQAQRAIIQPIKVKLDAGEELTEAEQTLLDEAKVERKAHGKWKKGGKKGWDRSDK